MYPPHKPFLPRQRQAQDRQIEKRMRKYETKNYQKENKLSSLITDQNYTNNILMLVFQTLQMLTKISQTKKSPQSKKPSKLYGKQDNLNQKNKDYQELLYELQTHVLNFETSKKFLINQHGQQAFSSFIKQHRDEFDNSIAHFEKVFKSNSQVYQLIKQLKDSMKDNSSRSQIRSNVRSEYQPQEIKKFKDSLYRESAKNPDGLTEEKMLRQDLYMYPKLPSYYNETLDRDLQYLSRYRR